MERRGSGGEGRRHAGFPGEETGSNSARSLRRYASQVHARSPHYGLLTLSPFAPRGGIDEKANDLMQADRKERSDRQEV